jgi:hypothetical protein
MTPKVALQKIRQLAKRGSNEMLLRAIEDVYLTGVNHGMQTLSNTLRERLRGANNTQQESLEGISSLEQHETAMSKPQEPIS